MKKHPPWNFPQVFEEKYSVSRDDYDLLISALELTVRNPSYSYREYVLNILKQGFDVRVAVVNKAWNGKSVDPSIILEAYNFAKKNNLKLEKINAHNDPHLVARKIRDALYPP